MTMIKPTSQDIINFTKYISTSDYFKGTYTDVWLDFFLVLNLFKKFKGTNKKISDRVLLRRLNFVSESKSYNLNHKHEWNKELKKRDNYYLISSANKNIGMNSRRYKKHFVAYPEGEPKDNPTNNNETINIVSPSRDLSLNNPDSVEDTQKETDIEQNNLDLLVEALEMSIEVENNNNYKETDKQEIKKKKIFQSK